MDRAARELHLAKVWAGNRLALHPAPEVEARLAAPEELSRNAASLRTVAAIAGWVVTATYARGTLTKDVHGVRKTRVIDSLALRMRHPDGRRAIALYHDGKAKCGYVWRKGEGRFPRKCSVTEVKAFIVWSGNE